MMKWDKTSQSLDLSDNCHYSVIPDEADWLFLFIDVFLYLCTHRLHPMTYRSGIRATDDKHLPKVHVIELNFVSVIAEVISDDTPSMMTELAECWEMF